MVVVRVYCKESLCLHCPWLPKDMAKRVPPFELVGRDVGHAASLKHCAQGYPMQIMASSGDHLSWKPRRGPQPLAGAESFPQVRSCPKTQGQGCVLEHFELHTS